MKFSISILTVLLTGFVLIFSSCEHDPVSELISSEERSLASFHKIEIDGVGNTQLIPDSEYRIEIITHVDLFDDIITNVIDGKLYIDLKGKHKKIQKLEYKVYAPFYDEIKLDAVGDIYCFDGFEVNHLTVIQKDVGKIDLRNISANSIYAHLNDVGDILLSGSAADVMYRMDGVGSIHGFNMISQRGEAILEGVGDIEIHATEELILRNSGVGKIYYKGNPQIEIHGNSSGIISID